MIFNHQLGIKLNVVKSVKKIKLEHFGARQTVRVMRDVWNALNDSLNTA